MTVQACLDAAARDVWKQSLLALLLLAGIAAPSGALPATGAAAGEDWSSEAATKAAGILKPAKEERLATEKRFATRRPRKEEPGLYHGPYYGSPRCSYDDDGYEYGCDINYLTLEAQVGWQFTTSPLAKCIPGPWSLSSVAVVWGSLPPGLWIDGNHSITGVPREQGTWHFTLEFRGVRCNNANYGDRIQYLTITTGTPTHPPYPGPGR